MHSDVYLVYSWVLAYDRSCLIGIGTDESHAVQLIKKEVRANGKSLKEITPRDGEIKRFTCGEIQMGEYDCYFIEKVATNSLLI